MITTFTALLFFVSLILFLLLAKGLVMVLDWFINFWTSDE